MYDDLLKLIDDFNERYKEEQEKAPYNLCLLDLCGANENAHTKILVQLLKYKADEKYPFLESLLKRWFRNINLEFDCRKLEISFNKDLIDGLICDNKRAVIIENKIHYAQDQSKQIERYVERVKEYGIDLTNIHVVYLTRYGDKKVSDNSCSPKMRENLGKRFVESNYCYDILPWLKEDVLPNCKLKDGNLVSALKQYIDHLDGMCGQRSSNGMDEKLKEWLKQELRFAQTPEKYRELDAKIDMIDKLRTSLDSIRQEPHESFVNITKNFWEKYYGKGIAHVRDGISGAYNFILFGKEKWNVDKRNRLIHLEWKISDNDLIYNRTSFFLWLHFEKNDSSRIVDALKSDEIFKECVKSLGMKFEDKSINAYVEISLGKEFASMDYSEKESFLNGVYEKYAPLLDYVYKKCEEVYKNE